MPPPEHDRALGEPRIATAEALLDLKRTARARGVDFDPGSSHAFTVDDLGEARRASGLEFRTGDVIRLRSWIAAGRADDRHEFTGAVQRVERAAPARTRRGDAVARTASPPGAVSTV